MGEDQRDGGHKPQGGREQGQPDGAALGRDVPLALVDFLNLREGADHAYNGPQEANHEDGYTRAQVISLAEQLSARVMPEAQMQFVSAERERIFDGKQRPCNIWLVHCTNGSGADVSFRRDAKRVWPGGALRLA